jgi:hypothetical protein
MAVQHEVEVEVVQVLEVIKVLLDLMVLVLVEKLHL